MRLVCLPASYARSHARSDEYKYPHAHSDEVKAAEALKGSPIAVDARIELIHPEVQFGTRRSTSYQQWKDELESRPLLLAGLQGAAIFVASLGGLILFLKAMLPKMDAEDAAHLKIPTSFDELKELNGTLQIYKEQHLIRVILCFSAVYLLLQAFSLPGSMYLSILGGALFGLPNVILVCTLIATGASLCYLISASLGPPLLAVLPKWRRRIEVWGDKVQAQGSNLSSCALSFPLQVLQRGLTPCIDLIILRIAPLPPHWTLNVVAPHLGIGIPLFWCTTFVGALFSPPLGCVPLIGLRTGVLGVTFIHTQIGTTLDEMTSCAHQILRRGGFLQTTAQTRRLQPLLGQERSRSRWRHPRRLDPGHPSSDLQDRDR